MALVSFCICMYAYAGPSFDRHLSIMQTTVCISIVPVDHSTRMVVKLLDNRDLHLSKCVHILPSCCHIFTSLHLTKQTVSDSKLAS